MTRTWLATMTSTITTMMINAVSAPGREAMSEATSLSMGILSVMMFVNTPGQKLARYQTDASMGALWNAGRVNRHATRQKAYATKRAGRKLPKASSRVGGVARGWEKSVTCQNPMQTRHQNATIGLGRRTRKMSAVTRILKASAALRRSWQCRREVLDRNWNDNGKTDGKPMDVKPCALKGK
jgi:hypothetical protein